MSTEFDARQVITHQTLENLSPTDGTKLDAMLFNINAALTIPGQLFVSSSLLITVGSGTVTNPASGLVSTLGEINGVVPVFAGGTVTFPASSSGTVVVSPGTNTTLTLAANQYIKASVDLNAAGNMSVTFGVQGSTPALATSPIPTPGTIVLGFVLLRDISGTVSIVEAFQVTGPSANTSVDTSSAQTLSNKSFIDDSTFIIDDADSTKAVKFEVSTVSPSTTRTWSFQDTSDTLAGRKSLLNTFVPTYTADAYTILPTQSFLMMMVDTTSAVKTLTLPSPVNGFVVGIKDASGTANTKKIVLNPAGTTIDGVSGNQELRTKYGSWMFVSDGVNWFRWASQGEQSILAFDTVGTDTWIAPAGVYSINLIVIGGGGGGAGGGGGGGGGPANGPQNAGTGAGGGGGGSSGGPGGTSTALYFRNMAVTPGTAYPLSIGSGGNGGSGGSGGTAPFSGGGSDGNAGSTGSLGLIGADTIFNFGNTPTITSTAGTAGTPQGAAGAGGHRSTVLGGTGAGGAGGSAGGSTNAGATGRSGTAVNVIPATALSGTSASAVSLTTLDSVAIVTLAVDTGGSGGAGGAGTGGLTGAGGGGGGGASFSNTPDKLAVYNINTLPTSVGTNGANGTAGAVYPAGGTPSTPATPTLPTTFYGIGGSGGAGGGGGGASSTGGDGGTGGIGGSGGSGGSGAILIELVT